MPGCRLLRHVPHCLCPGLHERQRSARGHDGIRQDGSSRQYDRNISRRNTGSHEKQRPVRRFDTGEIFRTAHRGNGRHRPGHERQPRVYRRQACRGHRLRLVLYEFPRRHDYAYRRYAQAVERADEGRNPAVQRQGIVADSHCHASHGERLRRRVDRMDDVQAASVQLHARQYGFGGGRRIACALGSGQLRSRVAGQRRYEDGRYRHGDLRRRRQHRRLRPSVPEKRQHELLHAQRLYIYHCQQYVQFL